MKTKDSAVRTQQGICAGCSGPLAVAAKFCPGCGLNPEPLEVACPKCPEPRSEVVEVCACGHRFD